MRTTMASTSLMAATRKRKAAGKVATVPRYKNPKRGLDANGTKAWKVPTMAKTFPTSSELTYFVIKDLEQKKRKMVTFNRLLFKEATFSCKKNTV